MYTQKYISKTILTLLYLSTALFLTTAGITAETESNKTVPMNVTSDTMLASKTDSSLEFKGNVVVTREDSTIKADSIKMFFTKEGEKNKLDKIIAKGNVRFSSGTRKGFAGKAVYTAENEVLVLTENMPKVTTGENSVSGKKITLFQKDGRIIIEGGVNATFNPEDAKKLKKE